MRRILAVVVFVLVVAVLGLLLWPSVEPEPDRSASAAPSPVAAAEPAPHPAAPEPAPAAPPAPTAQRMDATTRAQLLAEIGRRLAAAEAARAAPASAGPAASGTGAAAAAAAPADEAPPGSLDKEYIRAQVREIVPLVKECYEQALETQPGLAATLKVRFTIEGDPELGGVISSSDIIDHDGGVAPGSLGECVRETMYALRLKAPEGGGKVTVTYPFRFASR